MIKFHAITDFEIADKSILKKWIKKVVKQEGSVIAELNFIFCDDEYLLEKNKTFLKHDTLTDIITFDYSEKNTLTGDVYISIERVKENAQNYEVSFKNELHRVIIHGVLHLLGYKDKDEKHQKEMREKEDFYLSLQT